MFLLPDNLSAYSHLILNFIATFILLVLIGFLQHISIRALRNTTEQLGQEYISGWVRNIRLGYLFLLIGGIFYIWLEAGLTLVSISAVIVACVIATKELLVGILGAFYRFRGEIYDVGDRVQIGEIRGDVVDITFLTTTLMEIGGGETPHGYSGRLVVVPNAKLVSEPIKRDLVFDQYFMHALSVPLNSNRDDWKKARDILLQIAQEKCQDYLADATKIARIVSRNRGIKTLSVEPQVFIQLPEIDQIRLTLRYPVPLSERGYSEQLILEHFTRNFYKT